MPKSSSLVVYLAYLSKPLPSDWTPEIWQRLYEHHQPKYPNELFFRLLPYASEIEKAYEAEGRVLSRKESLDKLAKIAAKAHYQDETGDENTMLVFFKHQKSEADYDSYKTLIIQDDATLIPEVTVQGSEIGVAHASFYLTKFNKSDPRAAVIGAYTGCCETLNGVGEGFVKIALTQPFAGYYVLYDREQQKNKQIIAHCIAWRVGDAMVYSSIETNINYRDRLPLIADFYYLLAKKLMLEHSVARCYVWEWHDHTPPFLGLDQPLPVLDVMLMESVERLGVTLNGYHAETTCIADRERPYLNCYAKIRKNPVFSTGLLESSKHPLSKREFLEAISHLKKHFDEDEIHALMLEEEVDESSDEMAMRQLYLEQGIELPEFNGQIQDLVNLHRVLQSMESADDALHFSLCLDLLSIPINTNNLAISGQRESHDTLFANAKFYYASYVLINRALKEVSKTTGLDRGLVSEVIKGFHYQDGVRNPFGTVDLMNEASLQAYLAKFFDFCLSVRALKAAASATDFYREAFLVLYRQIAPVHPVTCMEILRHAIKNDQASVVDAILQAGFDVNQDHDYQETLLIFAIEHNKEAMVRRLLRYGADINQRSSGLTKRRGLMPLEAAARGGLDAIFKVLIVAGANLHFYSECDHSSLLHHVAMLKASFWVMYLAKHGLDVNHLSAGRFEGRGGISPLYCAANENRLDVFRRLIKLGADINLKNEKGLTMWQLAKVNRNEAVARVFAEAGALTEAENTMLQSHQRGRPSMTLFHQPIPMHLPPNDERHPSPHAHEQHNRQ